MTAPRPQSDRPTQGFKLSQNESVSFESSEMTMPIAKSSIAGAAAYTREPYRPGSQPPGYRGKLNLSEEELERILTEAHGAGWQLGIHAIGDAAIELTVDLLAKTLEAKPREDHRHYLNHFTVMPSAPSSAAMAELPSISSG